MKYIRNQTILTHFLFSWIVIRILYHHLELILLLKISSMHMLCFIDKRNFDNFRFPSKKEINRKSRRTKIDSKNAQIEIFFNVINCEEVFVTFWRTPNNQEGVRMRYSVLIWRSIQFKCFSWKFTRSCLLTENYIKSNIWCQMVFWW